MDPKYFPLPVAEMGNQVKDAAWWVTSDAPEAMNWRKAANGLAVDDVAAQALQTAPTHFPLPVASIERPPTVRVGFFNVPQKSASDEVGSYFTIPGGKA